MASTPVPPRRDAHVHSPEDAARHGHEVRREGDDGRSGVRSRHLGHPQFDLRQLTVRGHAPIPFPTSQKSVPGLGGAAGACRA
jgi:hypothetical protein